MSVFLENELTENKEILDLMVNLLKDFSKTGVKKIKKGNFFGEYSTPKELMETIRDLKKTIHFQENGARRKWQ